MGARIGVVPFGLDRDPGARRLIRLLALAVATGTLSACALVHAEVRGSASGQLGSNVERSIDIQFQPWLRSYDRAIHVGHASCPTFIELSGGKTGRCTLPIGSANLPIIVTPSETPQNYHLEAGAVVLSMRIAEKYLTQSVMSDYGVRAVVACGTQRVRVVAVGTRLSCQVRGAGLPRSIVFKVMSSGGQVFVYPLPGRVPRFKQMLRPYLHKHRIGEIDLVPGRLLDEGLHDMFVANDLTGEAAHEGAAVRCPDPSDLTGNRHVRCSVVVGQGTVTLDVWIDATQTLRAHAVSGFADTKQIESAAKQLYEDKLVAAGLAHAVSVHCGPRRVVTITRETKIGCTVDYGTGPRPLTVSYPAYPERGMQLFIPPR